MATAYYVADVAGGGSDSNAGTLASPWATTTKVNSRTYVAGDSINFKGGITFTGVVSLSQSGTASNPITITSYGTGRALLSNSADEGIFLYNNGYINITNINITGVAKDTNGHRGILAYHDSGTALSSIHITDVDLTQCLDGLRFWITTSGGTYNDIRLLRVTSHHNKEDGGFLLADGGGLTKFTNVYVGYSEFNNNDSGASGTNGGNGFWISNVTGALIEHNHFHHNVSSANNGNEGFMAVSSDQVIVQYNESDHNTTSSTKDGIGFDFDSNVTNSTLQYNYSHDNDGAGYYFYDQVAGTWGNNVLRYSISQNDGRKNQFGCISIASGFGQALNGTFQIYNMTVYSTTTVDTPTAYLVTVGGNSVIGGGTIRNSIFYAGGNASLLSNNPGGNALTFQGNDYYTAGAFHMYDSGGDYTSLAAWRTATGQEMLSGSPVGYSVNPLFVNAGGGVTGDASAYTLTATSPLIDTGLDLTQFGINPGTLDYVGSTIPQGARVDVGAVEYRTGVRSLAGSTVTCVPTIPKNTHAVSL